MLNYKIFSESKTISFQKPVIVFIHGLGGGYNNWRYQARNLKKKYDLVYIELPSHGACKYRMSELELDFSTITRMILEVLDHLGVEKAFFAGISVGSVVVKHIVLTHPERVERYILAGPIGRFTWVLRLAIRLVMLLLPIAPLDFVLTLVCLVVMPRKSMAYGRNLFLGSARRVEKKEFIAWCRVLLSFVKVQRQYEKVMGEEPDGLYLVGELDYFFQLMLKADVKRIKNLVYVEGAGHICSIDRYAEVDRLITEFVDTGTVNQQPPATAETA